MKRLSMLVLAIATALSVSVPAAPVRAADMVRIYDDNGGICGESWVLGRIERLFRHQVENVPHLPDADILDFYSIHEQRYLPESEQWPIGRRYCGATVRLSNGHDRPVWYLIEEGAGFAGVGDKVEFCVSGFDRWNVYNGHCRVLR